MNGERESVVLHERLGCLSGCGGGWDEPAARTELGNILARVRVGIWARPESPVALADLAEEPGAAPLFGIYAPWWLEQKIAGVIGDRPIAANTIADYRNRLRHLLDFLAAYRLDQIDPDLCLELKAHLLREAQEQREALAAGADLRDPAGRTLRPLGPAMIQKTLACLASILDEAVEDRHLDHNPARGRRMKVRVPKPKCTFLEMDELAYLLDAAADQDVPLPAAPVPEGTGASAAGVARLAAKDFAPPRSRPGSGSPAPP